MSLIGRFEHLPKRPRSDEARPLLEKIASQVKPIMTKRGWKVGTLAEFFPSNPALLGLNTNHGQRINLRLRPPSDPDSFYEFEQLVLVMLHELTHIAHGPHDTQFYKLLGELEEEFYELKRKGYSGDGFHSNGQHLSGLRRNEYEGRLTGLAAAEKRLAVQRTIGKGGRLGGSSIAGRGRSIREVAAEAAERRIRDDKTCATGSGAAEGERAVREAQEESVGVDAVDLPLAGEGERAGVQGGLARGGVAGVAGTVGVAEVAEAAREKRHGDAGEIGVIDLTASPSPPPSPAPTPASRAPSDVSTVPATATATAMARPTASSSSSYARPTRSATLATPATSTRPAHPPYPPAADIQPPPRLAPTPTPNPIPIPTQWACDACTLLNPVHYLACDACGGMRPARFSTGAGVGVEVGARESTALWAVGAGKKQKRPLIMDGTSAGGGTAGGESLTGGKGGWTCGFCGERGRDWEVWMCGDCGWVRNFG